MGWIEERWGFTKNPFSIKELGTSAELKRLFVNREVESRQLQNTLSGSEGGVVYGISGIRGSGKSTVLNKALDEIRIRGGLVFKVRASGTFSELDFLQKLLTDICDQIDIKKVSKKVKEELFRLKTNLLYNEKVGEEKSSDASIRASIKASLATLFGFEIGSDIKEGVKRQIEKTLKPYSKSTLTREILQFLSLLKKETKSKFIVIGIDETDKCRFEEAEKLLDSIKSVLGTEDCHFVFVGTLDFHKNFAQAFKGKEEEATLASIFEGIVKIPPLSDGKIVEIIQKRLDYYSSTKPPKNPFSREALKVVLELANGNPKQALRLCSESFNYFGDRGREIAATDLVEYFKTRDYILELVPTEKTYLDVVKSLGSVSAISEEFFEKLAQKGIKHRGKKQYRVTLENLVNKNYLVKEMDENGQVRYMLSELSKSIL